MAKLFSIIVIIEMSILSFFNIKRNFEKRFENVEIRAFLKRNCDKEEVLKYVRNLSHVDYVEYMEKDEILSEFRRLFPDKEKYIKALEENPFPPSLKIYLEKESNPEVIKEVLSKLKEKDFLKDIVFNTEEYNRIWMNSKIFFWGFIVFLSLLFIIKSFMLWDVLQSRVNVIKNKLKVIEKFGGDSGKLKMCFILKNLSEFALLLIAGIGVCYFLSKYFLTKYFEIYFLFLPSLYYGLSFFFLCFLFLVISLRRRGV